MRQTLREGNYSDSVAVVPPIGVSMDTDANDSDKSIVVPGNEQWRLTSVYVSLTTTATVGNRQLVLEVLDASSNVVFSMAAGVVQAASVTRGYAFMPGVARETAFVANSLVVPMPSDLWLKPGYSLHVYDSTAVATTTDDMTVAAQYEKYSV